MKKRLITDRPIYGDKSQYVFFNDNDTQYEASNGLPPRYDKFQEKDLYSSVKSNLVNDKLFLGLYFVIS